MRTIHAVAQPRQKLSPQVTRLLQLFGYISQYPCEGIFAGVPVTFYGIGKHRMFGAECFRIDSRDSVEIVSWAIRQYETTGTVSWDQAPYSEDWRKEEYRYRSEP